MRRAAATGLLGAALAGNGLLFALPSLVVPGAGLLVLAGTAAAWVAVGARRARVALETRPASAQEGQPITVRATGCVAPGSPRAELVLPSLGRAEPEPGGRSLVLEAVARFERRGLRALGPARLAVGDPLRLATRTAAQACAEVLVLPRIETVHAGRRAAAEGSTGASGHSGGPELEFDALRPHRPGTPASRIHWPSVARSGQLLERRLDPEADSRPLLVLDTAAPADEEGLDRAVRAAASLCRALAAAGGCRMLLPGDRRATTVEPDLRAFGAVHRRLALVEATSTPLRVPRTIGAAALFWVVATQRTAPRALVRAPARYRYLVAPGPSVRGDVAFHVAGCVGVRVGRVARAA